MKKLNNIHPGEVLREEFLNPLNISQYRLAKEIGVPPIRIGDIVHERRAITPDTSIRLARFFGLSDNYFLSLQIEYDLEEVRSSNASKFKKITPLKLFGNK